MKRSFRVFEGNALFFGKGVWLKIFCHYTTWFYIFSFTISKIFHVSLVKHTSPLIQPKYAFSLSVFGRDLVDTAGAQHEATHTWYLEDRSRRRHAAMQARKKLNEAELLPAAQDYVSGYYLDKKD